MKLPQTTVANVTRLLADGLPFTVDWRHRGERHRLEACVYACLTVGEGSEFMGPYGMLLVDACNLARFVGMRDQGTGIINYKSIMNGLYNVVHGC